MRRSTASARRGCGTCMSGNRGAWRSRRWCRGKARGARARGPPRRTRSWIQRLSSADDDVNSDSRPTGSSCSLKYVRHRPGGRDRRATRGAGVRQRHRRTVTLAYHEPSRRRLGSRAGGLHGHLGGQRAQEALPRGGLTTSVIVWWRTLACGRDETVDRAVRASAGGSACCRENDVDVFRGRGGRDGSCV